MYKYETHLHTKEASACAGATGREMVIAYKEAGYAGIIVTDHFFYGNTGVDRSLPWEDWVEAFAKGYENAKKAGDEMELQVFMGWESCYQGTEFLVYGLDKQWLLAHPEIKDATIEEQWELVNQYNGLIVHAHPFRDEPYIPEVRLFPQYVHAVEGINATHSSPLSYSHRNPEFNTRAIAYAKEQGLPMTSGSDAHINVVFGGGILVEKPLESIADYVELIKGRGKYELAE